MDLDSELRLTVVCKRPDPELFGNAAWTRAAVANESRVLAHLDRLDLPTPRLLGVDLDGTEAGSPALVMTRLPGAPNVLTVSGDDLAAVATLLARIWAGGVGVVRAERRLALRAGTGSCGSLTITVEPGQPRVPLARTVVPRLCGTRERRIGAGVFRSARPAVR